MAKQKRDNAYYEARLKAEHPAVHADLQAGRYRSPRAALLAAGLKKPRPLVREMQSAWKKASLPEREDFVRWIQANYSKKGIAAAAARVAAAGKKPGRVAAKRKALDVDQRLEPWAKVRLQELLDLGHKSVCRAAFEMGSNIRDASLRGAIERGWKVTSVDEAALENWIERESARHGLA